MTTMDEAKSSAANQRKPHPSFFSFLPPHLPNAPRSCLAGLVSPPISLSYSSIHATTFFEIEIVFKIVIEAPKEEKKD